MNNFTEFDKETYFNHEVRPLLEEALKKCNLENIPFYYIAAISGKNGSNNFSMNMVSPGFLGVELQDDRFAEYVKVNQGFVTETPTEMEEIEFY